MTVSRPERESPEGLDPRARYWAPDISLREIP